MGVELYPQPNAMVDKKTQNPKQDAVPSTTKSRMRSGKGPMQIRPETGGERNRKDGDDNDDPPLPVATAHLAEILA